MPDYFAGRIPPAVPGHTPPSPGSPEIDLPVGVEEPDLWREYTVQRRRSDRAAARAAETHARLMRPLLDTAQLLTSLAVIAFVVPMTGSLVRSSGLTLLVAALLLMIPTSAVAAFAAARSLIRSRAGAPDDLLHRAGRAAWVLTGLLLLVPVAVIVDAVFRFVFWMW